MRNAVIGLDYFTQQAKWRSPHIVAPLNLAIFELFRAFINIAPDFGRPP
jgi:hypothetical protein